MKAIKVFSFIMIYVLLICSIPFFWIYYLTYELLNETINYIKGFLRSALSTWKTFPVD